MRPKRTSVQGALVLASLGFILPFVSFSCQGMKVATLSGFQLASGTTISGGDMFQANVVPPNPFIIAALILGGIAFLLGFYARTALMSLIATACSAIAALALILFQLEAPDQVRKATAQAFSLNMELGYWVALILYATATVMGALDSRDLPASLVQSPTADAVYPQTAFEPDVEKIEASVRTEGSKSPESKFCPQCGSPRVSGKGFCPNCGEALDAQIAVQRVTLPMRASIPKAVPREPRKPLTRKHKLTIVGCTVLFALVLGVYLAYSYLAARPITVFVNSNLTGESLYLDGIDISNRSDTGRTAVNNSGFRGWRFPTTRAKHMIEVTHPNSHPYVGTINPGILEKIYKIDAFVIPITYPVIIKTNPSEAFVNYTNSDGSGGTTSGKDGIVQLQLSPDTYMFTVTKAGFPPLSKDVFVGTSGSEEFQFDLVEAKLDHDAQQKEQIVSHLSNASALFQQQQYDQALAECDAVLQMDPSNTTANKLRSQIQQTKSILGSH